jgi:hypothetical protein
VNDLHSRLGALADDLAPDADPYDQVAGARALHRRQRRTRFGMAAAAVAVALVAVGVPTAVGTLSAPGDGEVAGPSTSEDLRGPADAVRAAMAWWEEDGTVPDPARGRSCSAAELLAVDSRYEPRLQPRGSTVTACLWSTDGTGNTPAEARVDLELSAAADLDAAELMAGLDPDAACPWTVLFTDHAPNVLSVCESDGQRRWELTVVDDDGTGAWVLTAAVGTELDGDFAVGARSVGALWGVVSDLGTTPEGDAFRRLDQQVVSGLAALAARPDPRLYATPESMACRNAAEALSAPFGPEVTSVTDRTADGLMDCAWATEATGAPVTVSIRFLADVDGGKLDDVTVGAVADGGVQDTTDVSTACAAEPVTTEGVRSTLVACGLSGRTQLALGIEDGAGAGVWVLEADVPAESRLDAAGALGVLLGVAEQAW